MVLDELQGKEKSRHKGVREGEQELTDRGTAIR
jgi:hypothetical protein